MFFKNKAQHLTEVVLILAMVTATFMVMRLYIMRWVQARYKDAPDYMISKVEAEARARGVANLQNLKTQYDPYYNESEMTETREGDSTRGYPDSSVNMTMNRTGYQKVNVPGN